MSKKPYRRQIGENVTIGLWILDDDEMQGARLLVDIPTMVPDLFPDGLSIEAREGESFSDTLERIAQKIRDAHDEYSSVPEIVIARDPDRPKSQIKVTRRWGLSPAIDDDFSLVRVDEESSSQLLKRVAAVCAEIDGEKPEPDPAESFKSVDSEESDDA